MYSATVIRLDQNQNGVEKLNMIWPRSPKLLFYVHYLSLHDLHLILSPSNRMQTDQSGEEYQEFRAIEGFEYTKM